VKKDVPYGTPDDGTHLLMDVFRPEVSGRTRFPALIFFNRAVGPQRTTASGGFYGSWGQTAASKGIVGIVPDLRPDNQARDFQKLLGHLAERAADYGVDRDAIAVYAGSGNVYTALPLLEAPGQTAIKAAVMYYYYGAAVVPEFEWLRTIPQRFLPGNVANDPIFGSIKDRSDFRALFEPR